MFQVKMREISRTDRADLKAVEANIKNKFKWTWLQERDNTGDFLSSWARKVDVGGKVLCMCTDTVRYGGGGKKDLKKHPSSSKEHQRILNLKKMNSTLSSALSAAQEVACSLPYGAPEKGHSEAACSSKRDANLPKIVSFEDRIGKLMPKLSLYHFSQSIAFHSPWHPSSLNLLRCCLLILRSFNNCL